MLTSDEQRDPIYRTVFQVEVFSKGPYPGAETLDLEAINYDITEGLYVGDVSCVSSEVVPPNDVRAHLIRIGNDGEFFDFDGLYGMYGV